MKKLDHEVINTDVLVVGAGGAASRAAYEAKLGEPRNDVLVAVNGTWGRSGSTAWVASETLGINAPLNAAGDGDSAEVYLDDILKTGFGLASRSLASIVARESTSRIEELIDLGVKFDRIGNAIRQRKLSGCTRARSLSQGGRTGVAIVSSLKKACLAKGVKVLEGIRVLDLINDDGEVWGAKGIKQGKQVDIYARAVILASGGAGAIFPHNINHSSLQGDGYAMAYRAGAPITNMEFIQIGPGVVFPEIRFIIHSHMWNFLPRLTNRSGIEFLDQYLPPGISRNDVLALKAMSFPFSVRTNARYVDIAIFKELVSGRGTEHGGVYFDVTHIPGEELKSKAPITFQTFFKNGIDLSRDKIEIAPLVQSINGGIEINEHASSKVPGLFAAGEVSGGIHGADRPGGNNLTSSQVFGYRAGRAATRFAAERLSKPKKISQSGELATNPVSKKLEALRFGVDKALMIVRRQESLEELMASIETFRQEVPARSTATENFLLTSEMILQSALLRKESRGTHYREDFPGSDVAYEKPSRVFQDNQGRMTVSMK